MANTLKDWFGTFWRILVSPTPRTFTEEAEKAEDKFISAIGWTVFVAFYSYLLPLIKRTYLQLHITYLFAIDLSSLSLF